MAEGSRRNPYGLFAKHCLSTEWNEHLNDHFTSPTGSHTQRGFSQIHKPANGIGQVAHQESLQRFSPHITTSGDRERLAQEYTSDELVSLCFFWGGQVTPGSGSLAKIFKSISLAQEPGRLKLSWVRLARADLLSSGSQNSSALYRVS